MDLCAIVSSPSKNAISSPDNSNLTPRPLRINKRKRQDVEHSRRPGGFRTSSSSTVASSHPPPTAPSQTEYSHAFGTLSVRKQRQSRTARTNLATGCLAHTIKSRRGTTMSYPPTFMKYPYTREPILSTRAHSLATLQRDPPTQGVTYSSQPARSSSRQQSTASNRSETEYELPLRKDLDAVSDSTIRRVSSFRHRFFSRVMNGLISKSSGTRHIDEEDDVRRFSAGSSTKENAFRCQDNVRRPSVSTIDTYSTIDTDLQTALDSFPEPPVSNLTSPTELSSFEPSQDDIRAYRNLCSPSDTAIIRPEVSFIPEIETLKADANQNMYVAIQLSAVAESVSRVPYDRPYGLDVATIIDNSQFSSPATLMASCETARVLSTLLDPLNDRMAVICTNSIDTEHRDLRTVLPMSLADPKRTKAAVDMIASTTDRPNSSSLDAAVRSARALLEQSTPRDPNSELSPFAFGHIFVLTANSTGIDAELLNHSNIQLHLICAGSVPWKNEAKVRCNGWKLQSFNMKELQSVINIKDEDPAALSNRLRSIIMEARQGLLHGAVSDMILDIKPGKNCAIEGVIGTRNIPSLRQGERVMAFVRLKVGLPPAEGYSLTPRRRRHNDSSPAENDLHKELDMLLGTTPVTILNVKLKYRHSLLPLDTQCTLATECQLKRQLCPGEWEDIGFRPTNAREGHPQLEVQKRFAFHIATHHAPRQAMMVLIEDFGDGGRRSVCPDYIKLLIEELKYQSRTIERFDLGDYRSAPAIPTPRELRPDVWGEEHFGQGLFDASNYKPQEWITDVPDEIMVQLSLSPAKSQPRDHYRSQPAVTGAKRTVLQRKPRRQVMKGGGSENGSPGFAGLSEATRRLEDLAFKDQRILGAETLKCYDYPQYRGEATGSVCASSDRGPHR